MNTSPTLPTLDDVTAASAEVQRALAQIERLEQRARTWWEDTPLDLAPPLDAVGTMAVLANEARYLRHLAGEVAERVDETAENLQLRAGSTARLAENGGQK